MTNLGENVKVSSQSENGGFKVEILEYTHLKGSDNLMTAQMLHEAKRAGMRLKMVRITLHNAAATLEAGALYYLKGRIEVTSKAGGTGGIKGFARGLATKALTNETMFRPSYKGNGEIYLEPSFGHYLIYNLQPKQALIVDKGMFFCSEGSVGVKVEMQRNLSSGMAGGEGWFQTKVIGPGICVFSSPVPVSEIVAYDLNNDKLQVDGNFALMRTDGVRFSVQRSAKGFFASATTGEGLLQTFEGTGRVWLAPTQGVYDRLSSPWGVSRMSNTQGGSNTRT